MIRIISSDQPGNYGPMDILYDTSDDTVMIALDVRDYEGGISPQYSEAAVLLTFPDDLVWLISGIEAPDNYTYVRSFPTYQDYCTWLNQNSEIS